MNRSHLPPPPRSAAARDALETRFARRLTSTLTEHNTQLSPDIGERLRVAREQALLRGRAARMAPAAVRAPVRLGSVLAWFGSDSPAGSAWLKLASFVPLVALVFGLIAIQDWHGANEISAAAEVDTLLLTDDLPPSAYGDAGFLEFLKSPRE